MKNNVIVRRVLFFISIMILTFFDQFTKYLATINLKDNKPFVIISDVLELHYLDGGNTGAAWGILSGNIIFFIIVTIIISTLMVMLLIKIDKLIANNIVPINKLICLQFVLVILLSGAIGNLIDRIFNGYVVDFIYFKLIDFPIFNVADCYVTVGAILFFILCMFSINDEEFSMIFRYNSLKKDNSQNVLEEDKNVGNTGEENT